MTKLEKDVELLGEVSKVDVLELAGRIVMEPRRTSISTAGGVALALAVERFWDVCVEANVLLTAMERRRPWSDEVAPDVALAAGRVRGLLIELSPDEVANTAPQPEME